MAKEMAPTRHQSGGGFGRPRKSMRIFGDQKLAVRKSWRDFPYGFRTVRMICLQVLDFMALPTGLEPVLQP